MSTRVTVSKSTKVMLKTSLYLLVLLTLALLVYYGARKMQPNGLVANNLGKDLGTTQHDPSTERPQEICMRRSIRNFSNPPGNPPGI